MSLLNLTNTTLLFVETRAHAITERVIADCLSKADFGDVVVYTDKPDLIRIDPDRRSRMILCDDFPNKKLAGQFYYGDAMVNVTTDFALLLEWDGGIFDPAKWRDEFFNYDYIGAPWTVAPGDRYDVGNGGFTLMSRKLGHFVHDNLRQWPVSTDWDFCRKQRQHYEAAGFKWPDRTLASLFSWELGPRNPEHFGFHGAFTWPTVLPKEEVVERAKLMLKSEYLTVKARQLFTAAPWVLNELSAEEHLAIRNNTPPGYTQNPRIPGMMSAQQRAAQALMLAQRRGVIMHQGFNTNPKGQKA